MDIIEYKGFASYLKFIIFGQLLYWWKGIQTGFNPLFILLIWLWNKKPVVNAGFEIWFCLDEFTDWIPACVTLWKGADCKYPCIAVTSKESWRTRCCENSFWEATVRPLPRATGSYDKTRHDFAKLRFGKTASLQGLLTEDWVRGYLQESGCSPPKVTHQAWTVWLPSSCSKWRESNSLWLPPLVNPLVSWSVAPPHRSRAQGWRVSWDVWLTFPAPRFFQSIHSQVCSDPKWMGIAMLGKWHLSTVYHPRQHSGTAISSSME